MVRLSWCWLRAVLRAPLNKSFRLARPAQLPRMFSAALRIWKRTEPILWCVVFFAVVGPMLNPLNLLIIPIPASYLFGVVPAFTAGALFALTYRWLMVDDEHKLKSCLHGSACGVVATFICVGLDLGLVSLKGEYSLFGSIGAIAGGICGLLIPQCVRKRLLRIE